MQTWVLIVVAFLIVALLVPVIRFTWWRVWYPTTIFVLKLLIKSQEKKHVDL